MKASVDRSATARVLADIEDAVRPVERARTAAAVERVLASATPSVTGGHGSGDGLRVTMWLCEDIGIHPHDPRDWECDSRCGCWGVESQWSESATPGMVQHYLSHGHVVGVAGLAVQREHYAPWNVSPHLFGGES